jgi:hypothetical protein
VVFLPPLPLPCCPKGDQCLPHFHHHHHLHPPQVIGDFINRIVIYLFRSLPWHCSLLRMVNSNL